MPGKFKRNEYDLVDEAHDGKIPVHNEDAFEHGLRYKVKYIGTKEIHKPSSRAEIVSAMRKIRYEYKIQGIKKDKTEILVSLDGIKVVYKKSKGGRFVKKNKEYVETVLLSHVINRVFYVSHDSQDLQIFSYIAKEGDIFKCCVFKAVSKEQAMHIVRTIGQAFEVCHKKTSEVTIPREAAPEVQPATVHRPRGDGASGVADQVDEEANEGEAGTDETENNAREESGSHREQPGTAEDASGDAGPAGVLTLVGLKRIFQQQLDHQKQEMLAVMAEVKLLRSKLEAETEARLAAQKQVEAVLKQNRELIITVQQYVNHMEIQDTDSRSGNLDTTGMSSPMKHNKPPTFPQIPPPQVRPSPDLSSRSDKSVPSTPTSLGQTSSPSGTNASAGVFESNSSGLDMIEPRQVPPSRQEFLQFAFDSSSRSDYFDAETGSESSHTSQAAVANGNKTSGNSSAETLTNGSPVKKQT